MGATAGMGVQLFGSYSQSESIKAQGAAQANAADINARNANLQADDALTRGDTAADQYKKKVNQMVASQKVNFAAQGINFDDTAMAVTEDTRSIGNMDALTIKNNAYREAMGYRSQAMNYENEGKFAQIAADSNSRNTLIAGGIQALNTGYSMGGFGAGKTPKETKKVK